jgi:hypothetical protein
VVGPVHRFAGLTAEGARVEEEVCVESSSLRKNFESVSQTSVNGIEIDATRTLRAAL